jgi:hypothetical protein
MQIARADFDKLEMSRHFKYAFGSVAFGLFA